MHKSSREYTIASITVYNQLFDTVISALLLYMVKCQNRNLIREVFFEHKGKPIRNYASIDSPRSLEMSISPPSSMSSGWSAGTQSRSPVVTRRGSNARDTVINRQPPWLKKLLTKSYSGKEVEDISSEIDHILQATNDEIISTYLGTGGSGSNRDVFGSFCELAVGKIGQHKDDSNLIGLYNTIVDCYCNLQLLINNNNLILKDIRIPTYNISNQLQSDVSIEYILNTMLHKLKMLRISKNVENVQFNNYVKLRNKLIRKCVKICKSLSIEIDSYPQITQDIISDINTIRINCSKAVELGSSTFDLVTSISINDSNRQLYYSWTLRYWLSRVASELCIDN